jgi:formylglycine-generating enzyme required for sulfatase activity
MGSEAGDIDNIIRQYSDVRRDRLRDELPRHRVFVDAFYIDKYEVTNARFQQFVQATGYRTDAERDGGGSVFRGGKWEPLNTGETWRTPLGPGSSLDGLLEHPVVQVTWRDARAYCKWAGKRLPTEAEWEKAARGTDGQWYPWGQQFDGARLNFCDSNCDSPGKDRSADDDYRFTAPAGRYEAGKSPYGVYDMAGNVWEWVADGYDEDYYQHSPERNPPGPASDSRMVLRGGSWRSGAVSVRAPNRIGEIPGFRNSDVGIRCAKSP